MKNAKVLHDTAQREEDDAKAQNNAAEKLQARASDYMRHGDMDKSLEESKAAQKVRERAHQYQDSARKSQQEAADLEKRALEIEREEQELRQSTQTKLESLESERKRLLGE